MCIMSASSGRSEIIIAEQKKKKKTRGSQKRKLTHGVYCIAVDSGTHSHRSILSPKSTTTVLLNSNNIGDSFVNFVLYIPIDSPPERLCDICSTPKHLNGVCMGCGWLTYTSPIYLSSSYGIYFEVSTYLSTYLLCI